MALYTEDVVTRFKADTKDYEFPIKEAVKTTDTFTDSTKRAAESAKSSGDIVKRSAGDQVRALEGLARETRGLANDFQGVIKGGEGFGRSLSGMTFSIGQVGDSLKGLSGSIGAFGGKVAGLAAAGGPLITLGIVGGQVVADLADKFMGLSKSIRASNEAIAAADKGLAAAERRRAQIVADAERSDRELQDRLDALDRKGKGGLGKPVGGMRTGGGARAQAAPAMTISPEEASRAAFQAEWGKPDLELSKQISAAAEASVKASTDFGEARVGVEKWELATEQEAVALRDLVLAQEAFREQQRLIAEETLSNVQAVYDEFPGGGLAAMLYGPHKDKDGVIQDLEETSAAGVAMAATVGAAVQGMANATGMAYGRMLGASVRYTYANKEQAKAAKAMQLSTGEAMRVMVRDTLKSVAQQSAVKAVMATAEGFAALARYDFGAATNAFTSAGYFAATAALAGAATAAVGSVTKKVPGGESKSAGGGLPQGGVGLGAKETQGGPTIINVSMQLLPGTDYARVGEATLQAINLARKEQGKPAIGA